MSDHIVQQDAEALVQEGHALRDALLAEDLTEVRFRARQMARVGGLLGLTRVEAAACALVDALGPEGTVPRPDYAAAVFDVSDALDEAIG